MKTVVLLGKRTSSESPKVRWPGCHLAGTTHSQQRWGPKYGPISDWDSWWDLHPFDPVPGYDGIKKRRLSTYRWYQTLPGPGEPGYRPLYLSELDPSIRAGVLFDKKRVLDAFPRERHGRWFTCMVDLLIANFILEGYEHIVLHGHGTKFDTGQGSVIRMKHMIDHCGVLVWMTVARERGIKVTIVEPSWYVGPQNPYGISPGNWGFRA